MIAVVDYKSGNLLSITNALERLNCEYTVTSDRGAIERADGIIFPGQGRIGQAMKELQAVGLDRTLVSVTAPFLGICLGLQLLGSESDEDAVDCLSVFGGRSRRFPALLKVPHLGWNRVHFQSESALFTDIADGSYFYFVHSYYLDTAGDEVVGVTPYHFDFPSALHKDNFFAIQFHPEKSGEQGLVLLKNFLRLCT